MNYESAVAPILREVRTTVMPHYGNVKSFAQKDGEATEAAANVLTVLDEQVEEFLRDRLLKLDPTISFVGEETGGDRTKERFWLVDPIDATAHFIRGLPFCTTMVALVEHDQVMFSAIYDFVNDKLFSAERGKGATMNGTAIHVSSRSLREAYVSYETHMGKNENLKTFQNLRSKSVLFTTACCGIEYTMIASGKLDGRVAFDPYGKDYDFAPGSLLVQEAGGIVANLGKTTYDYRNRDFIAANPIIFKELTEGPDAIFPIKT